MARKKVHAYLKEEFLEPIRDPLWSNIYLSRGFKEVIGTLPFQQLNAIRQLGPTYHVYPGATHTRFNHSLGVFHIGRRIISWLLSYPDCPALDAEGVRAFLAASLLHDLGHFPYAHSLKELPLKSHEMLTGEILREEPLRSILREKAGCDPELTAAIVDTSMETSNPEVRFFRNILSGVLDPDKLDYLNRDAYFCGVPYGIQDTDFVITKMRPHREGLSLMVQGIPAVENILFSKYLMFRTVYWHRVVRIAEAMIKKAIFFGLMEGCIRPDELYGLTDLTFTRKFGEEKFPYHRLIRNVANRRLFKSVWEIPFNPSRPEQEELLSLKKRFDRESAIAQGLRSRGIEARPEEIIIDIPEEITFDISLPIITEEEEELRFPALSTVFTSPVVKSFTKNLRKLRLFAAPHLMGKLPPPQDLLSLNE